MGVCAPCVVNEFLAPKDDQQPNCDSVSEGVLAPTKEARESKLKTITATQDG